VDDDDALHTEKLGSSPEPEAWRPSSQRERGAAARRHRKVMDVLTRARALIPDGLSDAVRPLIPRRAVG
jgi:hypothetical protein